MEQICLLISPHIWSGRRKPSYISVIESVVTTLVSTKRRKLTTRGLFRCLEYAGVSFKDFPQVVFLCARNVTAWLDLPRKRTLRKSNGNFVNRMWKRVGCPPPPPPPPPAPNSHWLACVFNATCVHCFCSESVTIVRFIFLFSLSVSTRGVIGQFCGPY